MLSVSAIGFLLVPVSCHFFFFNDTATTEIYTLSLHDALPIFRQRRGLTRWQSTKRKTRSTPFCQRAIGRRYRSEEHTSELQSRLHLVCRLLLEKKKKKTIHKAILDQHTSGSIKTSYSLNNHTA